jgi:hypothetical protein
MARSKEHDQQKILGHLKELPIKESAYKKVGVSHATFYRWMKEDKDFKRDVQEALMPGRLRITDLAESQLIKAIQEGEKWAIVYWLNNNTNRYNAYSSANSKGPDEEATEIRPIYVMGPIHDLAERQKAEAEAEEKRRRLSG